MEFSPREMVRAAGYDACNATSEKTIYLCIHWYDTSGARNGWAKGTVKLSFETPAAPVDVSVTPGDGALNVRWTAGTGGVGGRHRVRGGRHHHRRAPIRPARTSSRGPTTPASAPVAW